MPKRRFYQAFDHTSVVTNTGPGSCVPSGPAETTSIEDHLRHKIHGSSSANLPMYSGWNAHLWNNRMKNRRRRWTQKDMSNAYNAVKYRNFSLRSAASTYNVPESTLRDRIHGRVSVECSRPGPPTFFTYEEEKRMVDHILYMSKIGYPYTRNQVVELAGDMTKSVDREAPFKYLNPSQAWFYAFLNRWPDLKNFLYGPRSTNRRNKGVSGDAMHAYFEQLHKVITKFGVKNKPEHFWMFDELCISCEHQPPRILPISVQRSQSILYWTPTVSMIGGGSAAGEKIPPFMVFKGDTVTDEMMCGSVKGTQFCNSPQGWINSDVFLLWFMKHFRVHIRRRPVVLLYDGHLQYVTLRIFEQAKQDGIILFPLPPHPAYNHCVENTCFWAFNRYFKKKCDRMTATSHGGVISRTNISAALCHAHEFAVKPSNLMHLFHKLGICPFNNIAREFGAYYKQCATKSSAGDDTRHSQSGNEQTAQDEDELDELDEASNMMGFMTDNSSPEPQTATELLFSKRNRTKKPAPHTAQPTSNQATPPGGQEGNAASVPGGIETKVETESVMSYTQEEPGVYTEGTTETTGVESNEAPCVVCGQFGDANTSQSMVQCSYCGSMVHLQCCNSSETSFLPDSTFICPQCQEKGHEYAGETVVTD